MISKTELLERPYWNKILIDKLLPEPDKIVRYNNGHVRKYQYTIERVEEAETTGVFQERIKFIDSYQAREQETMETLKAGLEKATEMDLRSMVIPETGDFLEVYAACEKQFPMRKAILKTLDHTYLMKIQGYNHEYADPYPEVCKRIAKARPELAFEAGINYMDKYYGMIGGAAEIIQELKIMEDQEAELGEPVYLLRVW